MIHKLECSKKDSSLTNSNDPNDVIPVWGTFDLDKDMSVQRFWEYEVCDLRLSFQATSQLISSKFSLSSVVSRRFLLVLSNPSRVQRDGWQVRWDNVSDAASRRGLLKSKCRECAIIKRSL